MKFRDIGKMLMQTFNDFMEYKVLRMSAALAYYTVFAIGPMLIVIITLCDVFYGREAIEGSIYDQINDFVGAEAAAQIQEILKNASISNDITWASIVGGVSLVFAATGVFTEIQDSINTIWRLKAKPKKGQGLLKFVLNRLLSFSMIIGLGFVLLVSLLVNAIMDTLLTRLISRFPEAQVFLAYIINYAVTFFVISLLFAGIFKILPDARVKWKDVWKGAFATALLFMLGKFGISFYLGKSHVGTAYGAAGSLVIILLWVYYSSAILYFGAAYTRVHACFKGRQIYPNEYAVFLKQVEEETKAPITEVPAVVHKEVVSV
ncbi:membrane protein [Filimonas lacunae]|uniref:Membrane protein n=1 Tax=Filimonas lacunae TaxID=477680 RepID=A0A173MNN5_9BACT|nr:YihY/virulence factor BrkB family protein [Filimonas lacunae]BAV09060.1 ribonuclease BN [Filimonas lacunae]SIS66641.1 membrane protein [Filimonas lacunae]